MPAKPGSPKKAGRKKGVPNKASRTIREALEALNFDIPGEFVRLYRNPDMPLNARLRLLETLLQYSHPRLKEQEVPTTPQEPAKNPASDLSNDNLVTLLRNDA